MSDRAAILATALIRNFDEVPLTRMLREPLYDSQRARLAQGTAARKSTPFEVIERRGASLDYWDGEP